MFHKYNLSDGYEHFIYYDDLNGKFFQFMYSGHSSDPSNPPEILGETFHTNLHKGTFEYNELYLRFSALKILDMPNAPSDAISRIIESHFHSIK
uniref:Uncharacterized protein n=1 Tax=viral metagenome TaxID=1070528 RepID=A0A6C0KFX9_9ZZZZ